MADFIGLHCLECDENWEGESYICPDCNSKEVEEIYELKCVDCGYEFEGGSCDICPECEGDTEETY